MTGKIRQLSLLLVLMLLSCSEAPVVPVSHRPETIAKLSAAQVNSQLAELDAEIDSLETEIHSAEARRDHWRVQQGADAQKAAAVEGVEADLASLQSRKGVMMERQRLLEKRRRELQNAL